MGFNGSLQYPRSLLHCGEAIERNRRFFFNSLSRDDKKTLVIEFLWVPFLACLVLTGIHVYLGLHVLARGIIFVDLALAQVAALGITVALLAGHPIQSAAAYWYALAFTLGGSFLFAISRTHRAPIPQEAIIGIVYAVSAAVAVLVVDRAPQGSEHIKQLLVGSILTVTLREVGTLALLYGIVGAVHWGVRRPLLEISFDPTAALEQRALDRLVGLPLLRFLRPCRYQLGANRGGAAGFFLLDCPRGHRCPSRSIRNHKIGYRLGIRFRCQRSRSCCLCHLGSSHWRHCGDNLRRVHGGRCCLARSPKPYSRD